MLVSRNVCFHMQDYKRISSLMDEGFPKHEILPVWLLRLMSLKRSIDFKAYYDGDAFVGFTFSAAGEKMAFMLFIAVDPVVQAKGYGSQMLEMVKRQYGDRDIALNMEVVDANAQNYHQRLQRLRFYEKNGFHETGYILPDTKCPYSILNSREEFDPDECEKVCQIITGRMARVKLVKA